MNRAFSWVLTSPQLLNSTLKTLDALFVHSDTAMLKVKKRGLYIMLSDFESLSCSETRFTVNLENILFVNVVEYTAKILLDSLANILRQIVKMKHGAVVYSLLNNPGQVFVDEVIGRKNFVQNTCQVKSAEHRARVFHIVSSTQFERQSAENYLKFKVPNVEFNKIVTIQAIISGMSGGVGFIDVCPDAESPTTHCKIRFHTRNHSGGNGGVTINTHSTATTAPLLHLPTKAFKIQYCITYLKRSQNLMFAPTDSVTMWISPKGLLLQTETKDHHSTLVFVADVSDEDLRSYS